MSEHISRNDPPTRPRLRIAVAVLCGGALVAAASFAGMRSTKADAFSAAQAERGKVVYERSCANCHQAEFYREQLLRWENKPVAELFEALTATMPADNVGSLSDAEYIDVLAYIFSITGSAPGANELTTDTMASISIASPE